MRHDLNKVIINVKDVSLNYDGRQILSGINFSIESNSITTIIGPNGGGKTSLLKIILGIKKPTKGIVNKLPHLKCSYVPQVQEISETMPLTVAKLLNTDYKGSIRYYNKIIEFLKIDQLLSNKINELSGGQKQMSMLARALLRKPDLLVLDEPDQFIDLGGQAALYGLIADLKKEFKLTIIIVSHNLNFVMKNSDHVICINNHICCQGKPQEILPDISDNENFDEALKNMGLYKHKHNHVHNV